MNKITTMNSSSDNQEISDHEKNKYRYMRMFNFVMLMIAYVCYYIVKYSWRKSLALEFPGKEHAESFAVIAMIFSMTYGFSKFISGNLVDRYSARVFISVGLLGTSVFNLLSGLYTEWVYMGLMLAFVAWFQGFGWPATAKMFTKWFSNKERPKWHAVWNASHNIGGAISPFLIIPIAFVGVPSLFGYMFVPSIVGIVASVIIWFALRNGPQSYGLKDTSAYTLERYKESALEIRSSKKESLSAKNIFWQILSNKWLWITGVGQACVYTLKNGIGQWIFKVFADYHKVDIKHSQIGNVANLSYELAGLAGTITAGFVASRWLRGDVRKPLVLGILLATGGVLMFWATPAGNVGMAIASLIIIGMFMYIPQGLSSSFCMNIVDRRIAATAAAFNGTIAYFVSAITADLVLGAVVKNAGYAWSFVYIAGFGIIGGIVFSLLFLKKDVITPMALKPIPIWMASQKDKDWMESEFNDENDDDTTHNYKSPDEIENTNNDKDDD